MIIGSRMDSVAFIPAPEAWSPKVVLSRRGVWHVDDGHLKQRRLAQKVLVAPRPVASGSKFWKFSES